MVMHEEIITFEKILILKVGVMDLGFAGLP